MGTEHVAIVLLTAVTSLAAYWIGRRRLNLSPESLGTAIGRMLESIGLTIVFFVTNIGVAMITIVAIRTLTPQFVSLYLADNIVLLVLSLLQGLTFQWWKES